MSKYMLWFVAFMVLLGGCSMHRLDEARPFQNSTGLAALAGTYQNLAQSQSPGSKPRYLSTYIWRDAPFRHDEVHAVDVQVMDGQTLKVSALGANGVLKTDQFVQGQHFQLRLGVLELGAGSGVAGLKSGEPLLGVHAEKISLGLDTQGQGKLRQEDSAVGLAMGLIPMAVDSKEDIRFVKIK